MRGRRRRKWLVRMVLKLTPKGATTTLHENDHNQDSKQKVVALKRSPPFTLKTNFYFSSKEEKEEED